MSLSDGPQWLPQLQTMLLSTGTLHDFLDELARLTVGQLPQGTLCGVTVRLDGRPITLASSDPLAREVDQLQYDHEQGPCLDTLAGGEPNYIPDTATEQRWAPFCRDAHAHHVRSVASLPLNDPQRTVGCYNLYSLHVDGFPESTRRQAEELAGSAAAAVAIAIKLADQVQLAGDLHQALNSRTVIDQATGIFMAQQQCSAAEAFDQLRRASQHRNIKLRDLAAEIVRAVSGEPPQSGTFTPRH
ncbi:MAG TPA: GAF and ANTAR domain-containing protein [Pseudonocardiaceae bacterium]|nr:GAF and ANTAR domain-containing protein [Pseudonocardiaceae bacterium]